MRHSVDNGCDLPDRPCFSGMFQDIMHDLYLVKIGKYNTVYDFFCIRNFLSMCRKEQTVLKFVVETLQRNKIVP